MAHCINIKHPEYIELLEKSGLKREILNAKISIWQEKNGLDKFPSVEELTYIGNRDNIDYNTGEITSTSEQKQQAQQLYAQYLEQNPNGSVEGFKSWVDGNRSNVQYQKQIDLQAEQDEVLEEFANSLSERFNISFDLISEEKAKSISPEYANEPAFFDPKTKKAYLVKGKANKTSAIHEIFTHPFLLQIEKTNPTLYKNLLKEAKNNKSVVDYVDNLYGTNQNNDHEYIARAIDLAVQGELDQQKDKTLLERIQDFFNQLYDYLKKLFNIPEVFSSAISPNITLQQLAQFAMYGKGKMNLNPAQENIEYSLKATNVIVKNLDKIKQWEKNKSISKDILWNKIQGLGVPKEQLELVKNSEGNTVEEKLLDFANQYSYTIEINTAKEKLTHYDMVDVTGEGDFEPQEFIADTELITIEDDEGNVIGVEEVLSERGKKQIEERENKRKPTQYYSNLSAPSDIGRNKYEGNPDWEYQELEFKTPLITPNIKGHAQFATEHGIGWARVWYNKKTGVVEIQELQSDLFQKGRDKEQLTSKYEDTYSIENHGGSFWKLYSGGSEIYTSMDKEKVIAYKNELLKENKLPDNEFLQLLNKNNNWVTFFIKSIIQDSAKKGYEKVLFPTSKVVSQIQKFDEAAEKYSNAISKLKKDRTSEDKFIISEWEKDSTKRTIKGTLNFYNNLRNTLDDLVGGNKNDRKKGIYKLQQITDEYGNTWNEVIIDENRDNQNIVFQKFVQDKQFQKLTAEEKAKTIEQVTKEHRSITALKDLSAKLAHRIGGTIEFKNRTDVDWKGYNQGMTSVLNEAYMTPDTPFHEILAHPIIRAIKKSKPELYQSLLKELETGRGKEVFEQVKRDYKYKKHIVQELTTIEDKDEMASELILELIEEDDINNEYTLEEQQEEAIVTLLGMMAADKLDAKKDATLISKLKELWKQISDFVKSLLRQDGIRIDELPITTTLNDLAKIMAYGNNKIILPGYKVEYSTPLGNKYDTSEEVNNEIREIIATFKDLKLEDIDFKVEVDNNKRVAIIIKPNGERIESYILYEFIQNDKEYAQSRKIIEHWKKENNIQYDPEEVYSRGHQFISTMGAFGKVDLKLFFQNMLQHLEDYDRIGAKFELSFHTAPIDNRKVVDINRGGGKVYIVAYPQSNDIAWASKMDNYSGSVWEANKNVSDKSSEIVGVAHTKAPSIYNIDTIEPNLATIIDERHWARNELGIAVTLTNHRAEYDESVPYEIKKLIDNYNKILDDKYGKLIKPEINNNNPKQPTKTRENTTSIESVKNNLGIVGEKRNRGTYDEIDKGTIVTVEGQNGEYYVESVSDSDGEIGVGITNLFYDLYPVDAFDPDTNPNGQHPLFNVPEKVIKIKEGIKKEYTSQAEINLKIAALKEVARKYPRSLITSKVVPINPNLVDNSEIQYSKVSSKDDNIKPGVEELFESDPELANEVYEALGFNNGIEAATMPFSPDNPEAIVYGIGLNGDLIGEILVDDEGRISSSIGQAGVELYEEYRGKGYGVQSYLAVARELAKQNKTLKSEAFGKDNINEAASKVWKSLIKQGYAVDKGDYYEITNLFTLQQKQQAQQLYSQYLDTIFPDSKVKDIVYHKTSAFDENNKLTFDKFKQIELSFYFTENSNDKYTGVKYGKFFPFLLNIKNPDRIRGKNNYIRGRNNFQLQDNNDGIIMSSFIPDGNDWYVVFEPEQIHILGSKQDIEGFKDFVQGKQFQQLLNNPNTNPTLQGNQEAVITPNDNQELLYKLNDIFEDRTSLIFNINNNKDFDTNNRLKAIRSLIDNKEVNYNNHLEHLEEYLELFEHLPVIYNLINKYGSKQAILEVYDNDNGSGNNNLQQEFIEAVNGLKSIFRNVNKTKLNSLENWLDENIVDINKIDIQDKDDNVLYPTEQYSLDVNNEKFIKYYYELSGKKEDIITFAKRLKSTIATYKLLGYNNDKILEMLKCL